MGNMCVSSGKCFVLVSIVHPFAMLSVVFCVICSLLMFVSHTRGDHMVETYSSMGLVMGLYVAFVRSRVKNVIRSPFWGQGDFDIICGGICRSGTP